MKLAIAERKEITEGTVEIAFDIGGKGFHFQAGQYIEITLPRLFYDDMRGKARDFSIASSPNDKKLRIAFRNSESGFKRTLTEMALGSTIEVKGPFGDMFLPKYNSLPIVFVAGGIGITPFLSMLRFMAEEKLPYDITIFYANRDKNSSAYLAELEELTKKNPNFTLRNHFGLIDAQAFRKNIDENKIKTAFWYVVGPPAMAVATVKILYDLGVEQNRVRFTEFGGYPISATTQEEIIAETIPGLSESVLLALNKNVLMSVTDLQGAIIYANDKFLEISKYGREELIGQNHRMLKSGFHPPQFYENLWNTITAGQVWRGEIKNKAKDGTFYWVDANIAPVFSKDNKVSGFIAIRFPITERKELEENTGESKKAMLNLMEDLSKEKIVSEKRAEELQKYQQAIQNTSQHIIITDIDGVVIYANPAVERTTGYSPAEVIGNKPSLWGRQMPQEFYVDLWRTIKVEKKSFVGELKNKRKSGEIYTVFANISPVLNSAGEVIFFIGLETDISKEKEFERLLVQEKENVEYQVIERTKELREEQAKLVAAINNLPRGLILIDTNYNILLTNASLGRILGLSGSPASWTMADIEKKLNGILDVKKQSFICQNEKKSIAVKELAFGKKFLDIYFAPIIILKDHEEVIGNLILIGDITDQKVLERGKEEFFSIASHELRTPLTAIRGNASLLQDFYADKIKDEEARQMIADMLIASERLIHIVNDFLDVSRIEQSRMEFKKEKFGISEVISNSAKEINGNALAKKIELRFDLPDQLLMVLADKDRVKQILVNLMGNAINYTKEGKIVISVEKIDKFVKVYVKDTGVGIPLQNQSLLFRKFQQAGDVLARDVTQGTGLGLYISKLIVESMGGVIVLEESVPGKGSTFSFTLPLAKD